MLTVSNIVSAQTGEGLVQLELDGKLIAQLSTDQAEEFSKNVMSCACVAETEAMLFRFMREKVGVTLDKTSAIIHEFRRYRRGE